VDLRSALEIELRGETVSPSLAGNVVESLPERRKKACSRNGIVQRGSAGAELETTIKNIVLAGRKRNWS